MPSHNRGSVSAIGKQIEDIPDTPTISEISIGGESATVTFTAPLSGGKPTTYEVEAYVNGVSTGQTAQGLTSPITIANLSNTTTYTFTIKGINARGSGRKSNASNPFTTLGAFTQIGLFTASGTFTVPSGITELGVIVRAAGVAGGGGGGAGGRGGAGVGFKYPVSAGQLFDAIVGSTSSFANLATAGATASSIVAGASLVDGALGGGGGGGSGSNPSGDIVLVGNGIPNTYKVMSGGGGGGGAGRQNYNVSDCNASGTYAGSGGGQGKLGGGNGGTGSGIYQSGSYVVAQGGGAGADGTGIGAGGGGGGGSANWYGCTGNSGGGFGGGNGSAGVVVVYGR